MALQVTMAYLRSDAERIKHSKQSNTAATGTIKCVKGVERITAAWSDCMMGLQTELVCPFE